MGAQYRVTGGQLLLAVSGRDTVRQLYIADKTFSDLAVDVDLRQVSYGSQGGYGLIFRHQDDKNCYRFTLTGRGQFEFGREYNNSWQYLENYAGKVASQAIRPPGEWNHLRVVAVGSRITAYVNGQQVAQVTDSAFRSGHVGLLVGTEETGDQVIVAFDDFVVYRH